MRVFKDNKGREWTVEIHVDAIKRIRSLAKVDLLDATMAVQLMSDPITLCDVIYAAVKPSADAKQVSDEDFGRSMAGDAIGNATDALLGELVDFFPQGRRQCLATAMRKLKEAEALMEKSSQAELEAMDLGTLSAAGERSTNLPESSASIPAA